MKVTKKTAADIAASLNEGAPTASEPDASDNTPPAPEQVEKVQQQESNLTSDAPKDKDGVHHDPAIHMSPPKIAKSGKWMKKRGRGAQVLKEQIGSSSGSFVATPTAKLPENVAAQQRSATEAVRQEENKAAAIACTNAIFSIGQAVGGPKFAPGAMVAKNGVDRKGEIQMLQSGFYETFEATGEAFKMPAWAALTIALGTYGAARMGEKDVQEHVKRNLLSRIGGPIGRWWKKRGDRKALRKAEKAKEKETTGKIETDQERFMRESGYDAAGAEGFA